MFSLDQLFGVDLPPLSYINVSFLVPINILPQSSCMIWDFKRQKLGAKSHLHYSVGCIKLCVHLGSSCITVQWMCLRILINCRMSKSYQSTFQTICLAILLLRLREVHWHLVMLVEFIKVPTGWLGGCRHHCQQTTWWPLSATLWCTNNMGGY